MDPGSSHQYWIPSHVRACSLPASTVLLDLKRNRYFGIGAEETRALYTLAQNWSDVSANGADGMEPLAPQTATRIAEKLVAAGLLSRDAPTDNDFVRGAVELGGTLTSVGHELSRAASVHLSQVMHFVRACAWARRALHARSLYQIVGEISRTKSLAGDAFDEPRAIELVCVFRRLRPYAFAAQDRCLFHALTLVNFLSRHDLFPTWVIGVRARPWGAHSWVQHGSLILDGSPEQVCEFTPILAV